MSIVYPSWIVTWQDPADPARGTIFRVSDPDLDAFLTVLRFNGVREFSVKADT
jgi:hypothetical protein